MREFVDDEAWVLIDPAAYRQILLNLLDNAVKFGPTGQTVTIRLAHAGVGVRRRVQLIVEDEGPGVAEADRERIWSPFVRLPAAATGPAGTGIGLAIVRDLAARHEGRAWVEGSRRGARFIVELPAAAPRPKDMDHGHATRAARASL